MRLVYILFALMTMSGSAIAEEAWEVLYEGHYINDIALEDGTMWCSNPFDDTGIFSFELTTRNVNEYTVDDGLLYNSCMSIAVDQNHGKWIGYSKGLTFYNGTTWNNYIRNQDVFSSCDYIVVDHRNDVYAGFAGGISKYDRGTDTWDYICPCSAGCKGFFDRNNHLWFGEVGERWCYDGISLTSYKDFEPGEYDPNAFWYLFGTVDNNNVQFWGGLDGLRIIDGDDVTTYPKEHFSDGTVISFAVDRYNRVWIGAYDGLYCYEHNELTHVFDIREASCENIIDIEIADDGSLYFIAEKRPQSGILARYIPDMPVGVTAQPAPEIVQIIKAHPNPFNGATMLSFSLPTERIARLTVHDITGRKIRELANGSLPAGMHSYVWDGRDSGGTAVASGVYISRLEAGNVTARGKMVFVK